MKISELFTVEDIAHASLFILDEKAWYPLAGLKNYMQEYFRQQNYSLQSVSTDGTPLEKTVVLYQGELFDPIKDRLEIVFGDATKGELVVSKEGKPLGGASVFMAGSVFLGKEIAVGKGVLIESGAMIKSPAIIGDNCEVRQGAYLRGYVLAGRRCVLGHATEIKHSIFLDDAKAGHFAYVGDSILGANSNLGAGTKLANLRFLPGNICLSVDGEKIDTGLRKLGAILGNGVQTGCNAVTSPGTIMGKDGMLFPNTTAQAGIYKRKAIVR